MKLDKILEDETQGNRSVTHEVLEPDQRELLSALNRMDGKTFSSTMFFLDDENFMSIGGGAQNRYVVFIALDVDQKLFTLIDPDASSEESLDVVVGGQSGSYPQNQCVDKEIARQALMYFSAHGTADPGLTWDVEG
ncbi:MULTISPECIES: Imm1 family immunity protein [unclassified Pseudomonas]|uniref:Imm1 family immunity protein n=1 Tax=unclassified Pseudomonas TaxID=196821 RepID=UPI000A1E3F3D|nr:MULTISPECIES: Imm1 family immunity protein [unclassified Pseudomonas]